MPLYIKPKEKVTVKMVADVMRDHYEGTALDMTTGYRRRRPRSAIQMEAYELYG
jgi:dipeptidase